MQYSGAGGKLIHKKNRSKKISWHCPFTRIFPYTQSAYFCQDNQKINLEFGHPKPVFTSLFDFLELLSL
jgi:hypothetical protein